MSVRVQIERDENIPSGKVSVVVRYSGDELPNRVKIVATVDNAPHSLIGLRAKIDSLFENMEVNWSRNRPLHFPHNTQAERQQVTNMLCDIIREASK